MTAYPTDEMQTQEMLRKISAYLESEEGQQKLKEIRENVESLIKDLAKQEEVKPELLIQPMTI